ncbi:MAG: hypothetical protein PHI58_07195, partial [Candidatus Omnitrophica bacterium]|nr:hypothetical protein [Candidatus Omnitrophota bacterium]
DTSYVVILPKFDASKGERPYVAILTNKSENYKEALQSGKYQLLTDEYLNKSLQDPKAIGAFINEIIGTSLKQAKAEHKNVHAVANLWIDNYKTVFEDLRNKGLITKVAEYDLTVANNGSVISGGDGKLGDKAIAATASSFQDGSALSPASMAAAVLAEADKLEPVAKEKPVTGTGEERLRRVEAAATDALFESMATSVLEMINRPGAKTGMDEAIEKVANRKNLPGLDRAKLKALVAQRLAEAPAVPEERPEAAKPVVTIPSKEPVEEPAAKPAVEVTAKEPVKKIESKAAPQEAPEKPSRRKWFQYSIKAMFGFSAAVAFLGGAYIKWFSDSQSLSLKDRFANSRRREWFTRNYKEWDLRKEFCVEMVKADVTKRFSRIIGTDWTAGLEEMNFGDIAPNYKALTRWSEDRVIVRVRGDAGEFIIEYAIRDDPEHPFSLVGAGSEFIIGKEAPASIMVEVYKETSLLFRSKDVKDRLEAMASVKVRFTRASAERMLTIVRNSKDRIMREDALFYLHRDLLNLMDHDDTVPNLYWAERALLRRILPYLSDKDYRVRERASGIICSMAYSRGPYNYAVNYAEEKPSIAVEEMMYALPELQRVLEKARSGQERIFIRRLEEAISYITGDKDAREAMRKIRDAAKAKVTPNLNEEMRKIFESEQMEAPVKKPSGIPLKSAGLALALTVIMASSAQAADSSAVTTYSAAAGWLNFSDMLSPVLGWASVIFCIALLAFITIRYLLMITQDSRRTIGETAAKLLDSAKNAMRPGFLQRISDGARSFISGTIDNFKYRQIRGFAEQFKAELDTFDEALLMERGFDLRKASQRPAAAIVALTGKDAAFGKLRTGGGKGYALFAGDYILLNNNIKDAEKFGVSPEEIKIFNPTNTAFTAARDAALNAALAAKKKNGDYILRTGDGRRITIGLVVPDEAGQDRGYIFDETGLRREVDVTDVWNNCDIVYGTSDKFVHRLQNEQMGSAPRAISANKWHVRADESDIMFEYEANTPFPIQGGELEEAVDILNMRLAADTLAQEFIRNNRIDLCAEIRPESQIVMLNAKGKEEVEKRLHPKDRRQFDSYAEYVESALIARWCKIRVQKDPATGKFVLVDETTGAPMPGRSLSRLQTAVEIATYRDEGASDAFIKIKVTKEHGTMSMMTLDGTFESGCVVDFGGLSATHRSAFMKARWNKKVYEIPSDFAEGRKFEDIGAYGTRTEGDDAVRDEIAGIKGSDHGMLLLAEDAERVEHFKEMAVKLLGAANVKTIDSRNATEIAGIEKSGIQSGKIIIMTNIGGRAVDYALSAAVAKSKGAIALITYFVDENTYEQFAGRIGRPRRNEKGESEVGEGTVKEIVTLEDKLFRQYGKELMPTERAILRKGASGSVTRNIVKRIRDRIAKKQAFDSKKQQEFSQVVEGYRARMMNIRESAKDDDILRPYMDSLIMEFLTYAGRKQYELDRKLKDYKLRQFAEVEQFAEYVQLVNDKFTEILGRFSGLNEQGRLRLSGYLAADFFGTENFNTVTRRIKTGLDKMDAAARLEMPSAGRASVIFGVGVLMTALSVAGVFLWNAAMELIRVNDILNTQTETYGVARYMIEQLSPETVFIIGIIGAAAFILFAFVLKNGPLKKIASMDTTKRDMVLSFKGIGNRGFLSPLGAAAAFFAQQILFNAVAGYIMPMAGAILILTGAVMGSPVAVLLGSAITVSAVILTGLNIWLNRQAAREGFAPPAKLHQRFFTGILAGATIAVIFKLAAMAVPAIASTLAVSVIAVAIPSAAYLIGKALTSEKSEPVAAVDKFTLFGIGTGAILSFGLLFTVVPVIGSSVGVMMTVSTLASLPFMATLILWGAAQWSLTKKLVYVAEPKTTGEKIGRYTFILWQGIVMNMRNLWIGASAVAGIGYKQISANPQAIGQFIASDAFIYVIGAAVFVIVTTTIVAVWTMRLNIGTKDYARKFITGRAVPSGLHNMFENLRSVNINAPAMERALTDFNKYLRSSDDTMPRQKALEILADRRTESTVLEKLIGSIESHAPPARTLYSKEEALYIIDSAVFEIDKELNLPSKAKKELRNALLAFMRRMGLAHTTISAAVEYLKDPENVSKGFNATVGIAVSAPMVAAASQLINHQKLQDLDERYSQHIRAFNDNARVGRIKSAVGYLDRSIEALENIRKMAPNPSIHKHLTELRKIRESYQLKIDRENEMRRRAPEVFAKYDSNIEDERKVLEALEDSPDEVKEIETRLKIAEIRKNKAEELIPRISQEIVNPA